MNAVASTPAQKELLQTLAQQVRRLERSHLHLKKAAGTTPAPNSRDGGQATRCFSERQDDERQDDERKDNCERQDYERQDEVRTTGVSVLDELLEKGGLPAGCLMEWLEPGTGAGVDTLALWGAVRARRPNELLIVIDSRGDFYPPGAVSLGLDLQTTAVIRPDKSAEALWTLEQSLRTPGVGVVVCPWPRLSSRTFRRLQLAAETGGSLGILLRPARARAEPSFAEVRWGVQALPSAESGVRRWRVELVRARRQREGGCVELELHDDGNRLHLVSAMAAAAGALEATGIFTADA